MKRQFKNMGTILTVLLLIILYATMLVAFVFNLINSFVFLGFLLLELVVLLFLFIIYSGDKVLKRRYLLSFIIVSLLIGYEFRLLYFESYTYVVTGVADPIEVIDGSGLRLLAVNSIQVQYLEDEELIKESYDRQFQRAISLEKITNIDRYLNKNSALLSAIGFKRDDFETMKKNVTKYLSRDTESIDTFFNRDDLQGDSAGLGLALSALLAQSKLNNNLDFGVTGALTSNGDVLAIGGLKEKLIISEEKGFPYIILPTSNANEAKMIKKDLDLNIEIIEVNHIEQAIEVICELNENM